MPTQRKTWILVKGCEHRPGGSISLGQILVKPFEPSLPLLPEGPLSIPEAAIERSHQAFVEIGSHKSLGWGFKLWADLNMLPISAELGGSGFVSKNATWHFDRIETETMVPRLADVRAAMSREEVTAQINRKKFDFRKRLYMCTGVRVARGARLCKRASIEVGGRAKVGVDLTALAAVPANVGPEMGLSRSTATGTSFEKASDFVYAYRVCEVHYGKDVYVAPYNKGDTFSGNPEYGDEESSEADEDDEKEEHYQIVVENLDGSDYDGAGLPHQSFVLTSSENENKDEEFIAPG